MIGSVVKLKCFVACLFFHESLTSTFSIDPILLQTVGVGDANSLNGKRLLRPRPLPKSR
jgi:hypothetical protein